jgi:two-component system KDP operon response regulator KdpE
MRTVLVFDADLVSRRRTMSAMRYGGFEVRIAHSVAEAHRLLRRNRYEALIVDPGTGAESAPVVAEFRSRTDAPIIAVSASEDQAYKVALLDAGADDYVTRPFDPEELLARVRAVSRRVPKIEDAEPIVTPDFTMHLADRLLVSNDDTEIALSPTEWRLIEVLANHMGHLVTREELLVSVWGPQAANKTQYLRVHMASIRRKIEPEPSHPRYFVTAPGLGLRFDASGIAAPAETHTLASAALPPCNGAG